MFRFDNQVVRRQGVAVLADLNLEIREGEKVALLGPSGAGKSSLLWALRAERPELCAWCPQEAGLVPVLSVFHNIYMGGMHRHGTLFNLRNLVKPAQPALEEVGGIATVLGLRDRLFTSVDRLSGGEAQRTALGRALHARRPVFLGDEPVSSVDEHQARELLEVVLSRHETAVVALHDQTLALECFARVVALRHGRLVFDAPAGKVSSRALVDLYRS